MNHDHDHPHQSHWSVIMHIHLPLALSVWCCFLDSAVPLSCCHYLSIAFISLWTNGYPMIFLQIGWIFLPLLSTATKGILLLSDDINFYIPFTKKSPRFCYYRSERKPYWGKGNNIGILIMHGLSLPICYASDCWNHKIQIFTSAWKMERIYLIIGIW